MASPTTASIATLARDAVAAGDDGERWARLVSALWGSGRTDDALDALDEASETLSVDIARRLLEDVTGVPFAELGRSFAPGPEPASTDGSASSPERLRPRPSPRGERWLVCVETRWRVVWSALDDAHSGAPSVAVLPADLAHPAWWGDDAIVGARDADLVLLELKTRTSDSSSFDVLASMDDPVDGLLVVDGEAPSPELVVSTRRDASRDIFALRPDTRSGPAVSKMTNLSVDLDVAAAPWSSGFACIGDGVQSSEVRFAWTDGGWQTRMHHKASVRAIAPSQVGVVTIDADGLLIEWRGPRPRPYDGGALEWLPTELRRRRFQAIYLPSERRAFVVGAPGAAATQPDPYKLWSGLVDDDACQVLDGIRALPWCIRNDVWPILAEDGWIWFDGGRLAMPRWLQLPARLATDAELAALPGGVSSTDLEALERWRAMPWVDAPPLEGNARLRIRCTRPVVDQLT